MRFFRKSRNAQYVSDLLTQIVYVVGHIRGRVDQLLVEALAAGRMPTILIDPPGYSWGGFQVAAKLVAPQGVTGSEAIRQVKLRLTITTLLPRDDREVFEAFGRWSLENRGDGGTASESGEEFVYDLDAITSGGLLAQLEQMFARQGAS